MWIYELKTVNYPELFAEQTIFEQVHRRRVVSGEIASVRLKK